MLKLPFDVKPCPGECGRECGDLTEKCPIYPSSLLIFSRYARIARIFCSTCECCL